MRKNIFHYCILFSIFLFTTLRLSLLGKCGKPPYFLLLHSPDVWLCFCRNNIETRGRKNAFADRLVYMFGHSNYSTWTSRLRKTFCHYSSSARAAQTRQTASLLPFPRSNTTTYVAHEHFISSNSSDINRNQTEPNISAASHRAFVADVSFDVFRRNAISMGKSSRTIFYHISIILLNSLFECLHWKGIRLHNKIHF